MKTSKKWGWLMNQKKGFSLVELMVVIAITGIIAAISSLNLVTGLPKYRLKRASRDITSRLRQARSTAIKTSSTIIIQFDTGRHSYSIDNKLYPATDGNTNNALSSYYGNGLSFDRGNYNPGSSVTFPSERVTFNSRGICLSLGSIYLSNNKGDVNKIAISRAGRIRLTRWFDGENWQ
jgi:type II secretion system protein H